jgi:hypothetical protein
MGDNASVTLPGTVDKIIPSMAQGEPEKVQISITTADHLYREIRIENSLTDENGHEVRLKKGADVEVTVEADQQATTT